MRPMAATMAATSDRAWAPRSALKMAALTLCLLAIALLQSNPSNSRLVSAAAAAARGASKCPAARDLEMDTCAASMGFLGDHSFRVPKNSSAMSKFCSSLKENINCIQAYSRDCLSGFTKQILNSFLKRGKQQQTTFCGAEAARGEFISKLGSCLTDDKIEQFHQCADASIARFEYILKAEPSENRLPSLCCSYQIFFQDVEETLGRMCGAGRTRSGAQSFTETLKYIQRLVTGTTGEFISLVCDNHRSLEECRASSKTRDTLTQLEAITKRAKQGKIKNKSKSLIPPLLGILDSGPS